MTASKKTNLNKTVALWDVVSGQRIWEFTPHNAGTYAVAFSPEVNRLITGGSDNTARIWSIFPWKMSDYPGTEATTDVARLESFKRSFWAHTPTQIPSEDRIVEKRPWGEKNLPRKGRTKTSPEIPIPPRAAGAPENQIDLSRIYNAALNEVWQPVQNFWYIDTDLAGLSPGQYEFNGISFDLRGVIQLRIELERWTVFPRSIEIPIGRKTQRFHVVHATARFPLQEGDGAVVGAYRMHFDDGGEEQHEIIYGDHLRSVWAQADPLRECARGDLVWTWKNPLRWRNSAYRRLYMATFENPRPEATVTHIEYLTGDTMAAPFLVGMTVE